MENKTRRISIFKKLLKQVKRLFNKKQNFKSVYELGKERFLNGEIDWANDDIKITLVDPNKK